MNPREHSIQWSAVTLVTLVLFTFFTVNNYMKRGLQGRLKSAPDDIGDQFSPGTITYTSIAKARDANMYSTSSSGALGQTNQYEPYYLRSNYAVDRVSSETREYDKNKKAFLGSAVRGRTAGDFKKTTYESPAVAGGLFALAKAPEEKAKLEEQYDLRQNYRDPDEDERLEYAPYDQWYPVTPPPINETYDAVNENNFLSPMHSPLSTFSIDVDTASYSNIRRFINQGQLPPADAVRIEEMINYFGYDYPQPMWGQPFSITTEVASCPWNPAHQLALIGLQGKRLSGFNMPASNLVFLIDVSGSMNQANKLPLLQDAFRMLTQELESKDKASIVVYAGAAGLVLDATSGNFKERILSAIDQLQAGGSTAGGDGIRLAYRIARNNFISGGNNRVILATDGDFNVGISNDDDLVRMIENYRDQGIFLTVLGFGIGNYKDSKMEKLADHGNGNYFYIDNRNEARKVLVSELGSTLFTIAKDVKLQVEFNPATVKEYRLIGYETRALAKEDFNDDTKDAGELGAGHTVTALYEIVPAYNNYVEPGVDPLIYQKAPQVTPQLFRGNRSDLMTVKLRYKDPKGTTSKFINKSVSTNDVYKKIESDNLRFASAVAEFGLLLKNSPYRGRASYEQVLNQILNSKRDESGYRREFADLVKQAQMLGPRPMPLPIEEPAPYYGYPENRPEGKGQK